MQAGPGLLIMNCDCCSALEKVLLKTQKALCNQQDHTNCARLHTSSKYVLTNMMMTNDVSMLNSNHFLCLGKGNRQKIVCLSLIILSIHGTGFLRRCGDVKLGYSNVLLLGREQRQQTVRCVCHCCMSERRPANIKRLEMSVLTLQGHSARSTKTPVHTHTPNRSDLQE